MLHSNTALSCFNKASTKKVLLKNHAEVCRAVEYKGHMPLMNKLGEGAYAPSKYTPCEI